MRRHFVTIIVAIAAMAVAVPIAEARPRGAAPMSCTVSVATVTASGLPTNQPITLLTIDDSGTLSQSLGYTDDGTFTVTVPAPNGAATYQFVGRPHGTWGTHYTVYATCS